MYVNISKFPSMFFFIIIILFFVYLFNLFYLVILLPGCVVNKCSNKANVHFADY